MIFAILGSGSIAEGGGSRYLSVSCIMLYIVCYTSFVV